MTEKFAELLNQSNICKNIRPGDVLNGIIAGIEKNMVTVDVRLKSEGLIPIEQFYDNEGQLEVAVGDEVEVALETLEDGYGHVRISREKAKWMRVWARLEEAHKNDKVVEGMIIERVKGGFIIGIEGGVVRAFMPGSLLDVIPVRDSRLLENTLLEMKVIKLDIKHHNVVVSRRAAMSEDGRSPDKIIEELVEGSVIPGVVRNITEYGAFLDIGGVDGLLHVTDMSWKRVASPADVVNIGDQLDVKILKIDRERNRISLGIKQMREDPWSRLTERYPVRECFKGRVTNIVDYGCFVELEEGVEGLVHISEMDWLKKNALPSKMVQVSSEVEVMVLNINEEKRRISLGMKQCTSNPWQEFAALHKKGDRLIGTLNSITDFGLFLRLDCGLDGLVHVSDVAWDGGKGEELLRSYDEQRDQKLEAMLLSVDADRERISLGIKQLTEDPFQIWLQQDNHNKGDMVSGTVTAVEPPVVHVSLADKVRGQIPLTALSLDITADMSPAEIASKVKEGQEISAIIVGIDRRKRCINLSVKARENIEERDAIENYGDTGSRDVDGGSGTLGKLGDIFRNIGRSSDAEEDNSGGSN